MRVYWVNNLEPGNIGLMARPKGNDWLLDEIRDLKMYGTDTLVSLLEKEESNELGLQNESTICKEQLIKFRSFPIKDRSTPTSSKAFLTLVEHLNSEIDAGRKIVIHCRMGIGRTGILAAGILTYRGYNPEIAFEYLSKIRTLDIPDTKEQVEWVKALYAGRKMNQI